VGRFPKTHFLGVALSKSWERIEMAPWATKYQPSKDQFPWENENQIFAIITRRITVSWLNEQPKMGLKE